MLSDTKHAAEGFDASGRSFLYHHLLGRGSQVKIPTEDLERYDANICAHLEKINRRRAEPITLRYFQYLAALYTEIILDRLFNHRAQLLADLNAFLPCAPIYMAQFRDYLEREDVETEPVVELPLFVWANEQFLQKGLVVPRPEDDHDFAAETVLLLSHDSGIPGIHLRVDLSVNMQALESTAIGLCEALVHSGDGAKIPSETLPLVDWEQAYLDMLEYKARKGWSNLVIRPEAPRTILERVPYTLVADDAVLKPRTCTDRARLQQAVAAVLRKYMDVFYRRRREQWDGEHLVYRPVDLNDPNLAFNRTRVQEQEKKAAYIVRVPASQTNIIEAIEKLRANIDKLIEEETSGLRRMCFDRSLYMPLLLK